MKVGTRVPTDVFFIIDQLEKAGCKAYIVGGCLRDLIMYNEPHDWDIATSAPPDQIKGVFRGNRTIDTGIKHGTVTLVSEYGFQYEITTFRVDGAYTDNRHPDSVEFVTDLKSDLSRRDFTINALASTPWGNVIDYFGGMQDIEDKVIRCVGKPDERFAEDGLRIMRALRFASTLEFDIEKETSDSIHRNKALLDNVSKERLRVEFDKLLMGKGVKKVLQEYSDVIGQFIPEIIPCIGFEQRNPYHYLQVWEHTIEAVAQAENDIIIKLTMFFHDIGKPTSFVMGEDGIGHYYGHPEVGARITNEVMKRLKYDNATLNRVVGLVDLHDHEIGSSKRSVRGWLNSVGLECLEQLLLVKEADAKAQVNPEKKLKHLNEVRAVMEGILEQKECFALKNLELNGFDLLIMGVPEGPEVGRLLNIALQAVLDGRVSNVKGDLQDLLKDYV